MVRRGLAVGDGSIAVIGQSAEQLVSSIGESGVSIGLGVTALAMLGYLFRSYWKQGGYWEQLTASARAAETLARADASAARAEAAAAHIEAAAARTAAERAQQAFEDCEKEHAATKERLQHLEDRLRELGFDV
jgi:hypothetical protein